MSKILILAKSGFGKSTSIGEIPELGIKGLNPKTTYLISCVNKPLPFRGANKKYVVTDLANIDKGNRIVTNDAETVAKAITMLANPNSPYKNIILDDMNYMAQDYYMKNALKGGWDCPKKIGYNTGLVFDAINDIPEDKNIICLAHYEEYKDKNGDSLSYKYKSTGSMVDNYITPEGKFEIVLYGRATYDNKEKKSIREFVTNDDGVYPAKSPVGMFDLYIPNDLGLVTDKVKEYYGEE
jgi:hypothetical protein